jgi:tetratricopeptide (TPR) repeat protein
MAYLRSRERQRSEPTLRERLQTIVRTGRIPEGIGLEALTGGISEAERRDHGRCVPPEKLLDDAYQVYFKAHEALRRTGESNRGAMRGCTLEMVVLVIKQALDLEVLMTERAKLEQVRAHAKEQAQARLRTSFARAMTLREQARRVIGAMWREDEEFQADVLRAATASDAGGSIAEAMARLAELARGILEDAPASVSARALLLGLDASYVATIEAAGAELAAAEAEVNQLFGDEADPLGEQILLESGLTLYLLMQVVEAFEAAHEIDPSIPRMRPANTQALVRRLSKLPAPRPPATAGGGGRIAGASRVPKFDEDAPPKSFRGNLGKAR